MIRHRLSDELINELDAFVQQVEADLLNPAAINFFQIDPNQPHEGQRKGFNGGQLDKVAGESGVYAIWIQTITSTVPYYIGHTAGQTARTRLTNHFFKRDPRTGSQLVNVETAVKNGHVVGFTFVAVEPPLIRLYVESVLIARRHEQCVWNKHSKGPKRKSTTSAPAS